MDKVVNIKMPVEMYEKLKAQAKRKSIPLSSMVRLICSEYLEKENER